jgi:hypothetical protein
MRLHFGLAALVVLAACGGDNSSEPQEPTYPAAAGTYAISGGFDGLTSQQANFSGTLTVGQTSRENPALTGNFNVTATIDGSVFVLTGPLESATITTAGVISFIVGGSSTAWSFSGTMSGTSVSGRHTLTDGIDALSGNWSMQRTGNVVAAKTEPIPPSDLAGFSWLLNRQVSR